MAAASVPPLRIQKGSNTTSPNKMPMVNHRPLSDLSPMALRRNSPSFPQGKAKLFTNDSSPAGSSPFSNNTNSPRLFWQGRDQTSPARENRNPYELQPSPGPAKRSSIENLKKASRVKNSGIFALEQTHHYDPARPSILDGRPLSTSRSSAMFDSDPVRKGNEPTVQPPTKSNIEVSHLDASTFSDAVAPLSPSKLNGSPKKSSLSKITGSHFRHSAFDPDTGIWEDDDDQEKKLPEGRSLHRHAKSVTFDKAPPQINEYEMTTPDPSSVASGSREGSYESMDDEEELSFERESSMDHDDSFDASLEDTDKTPVVMPEDWRFMSPEVANTNLAKHEIDVFDDEYGSPAPTANPGTTSYRPHQTSVNSVDSNGQPRPLPPLPAGLSPPVKPASHGDSLSGTLERMSGQRSLPSPPFVAGVSKSDIRRMSGGNFSMEDRLRLMMAEKEQQKNVADEQRERKMRRAAQKDQSPVRRSSNESEAVEQGQPGPEIDDSNAPRISRESIMRHMRSNQDLQSRAGSEESEARSQPSVYDPDVPIPSREDPTQEFNDSLIIKQEDGEENDLSSIPDYYMRQADLESNADDDLTSQYSQPSMASIPVIADDGQETPRANSPVREAEKKTLTNERMSLPDFMDFGQESSFDLGLQTYMTPPTEPQQERRPTPPPKNGAKALPDLAALRTNIQRPYTPQEQLPPPQPTWDREEPGTPDSVIRHPAKDSSTPEIPEEQATVKAPGAKLKVRPSLTASEADSLQQDVDISPQARQPAGEASFESSGPTDNTAAPSQSRLIVDAEKKPRVSSLVQLQIPQGEQVEDGLSFGLEKEFDRVVEAQKVEFERSLHRLYYPFNGRFPSSELPVSKSSILRSPALDVPALQKPMGARPLPEESHSPFVEGFANRIPYRQRGYLMRQNTKVVVASERVSHDDAHASLPTSRDGGLAPPSEPNEVISSPRKTSQPTWTAEPWNGKKRRKSIRVGGEASPQKRKEIVPPLPGQASAVQEGLGAVAEDELAEEEAEDFEDGAERGRLFVKVIGVKDLQLPFPKDEATSFALTLDNGMHCVTTAWLDLAKDAPIGQEFELVVLNDLEFQLTLQMKLEEPKQQRPSSPTKPPSSPKKQGAFGRFFGSPKKRKEDSKIHEVKRPVTPPSFYELVQGLVAKDGSFARAYISLNEHEKKAYGRPYSVDIKCFNEWAMEEVDVGSSRSKKSVTQLQRRPPYEIGKLELLLLYVPKPKGAKDEDMPKSMNSAVRTLREAEERTQQTANLQEFEGHLSQQGGDCPYWRRRFFKLVGPKLTAYHEATLQPRATINLAKATKLIDDKSALTKKETSKKGGGRRKSAFAEEEEGYMFVEEGFRIRFANGEVIDFYADSPAKKEEWMEVLSQVVGKGIASTGAAAKGWTEMVLKREKSTQARTSTKAAVPPRGSSKTTAAVPELKPTSHTAAPSSGIPLPSRPAPAPRASAGHLRSESYQPQGGSRSQASSPVKSRVGREERYKKAKSMIM